ncbi:hypothetical protein T459_12382 [Capsicum annuum]|uniref:Uncharacterized protein n=1 Tax=Capsicum annuum TaxID=4072 RepID=A0A2G2ZPM5_CAPAN|nr:hypothetical protein T459_12382 [Capsicum annuum]
MAKQISPSDTVVNFVKSARKSGNNSGQVPQILVERRYQRTNRDLLDNLPSTPDNIKLSPKGSFWIALLQSGGTPETRNGLLEVQKAFHEAGLIFRKTGFDLRLCIAFLLNSSQHLIISYFHSCGGRTSEMSAVDLLPAAFQGIDIREMLAGAALMDEANRTTMSELHRIDAFPLTHVIVLKEIKRKNRHEKEEKNLRSSSEP